jgi:hypothetical protein
MEPAERSEEARFSLGRVVMTRTAQAALQRHEIATAIARHARGDWGELCAEDAAANEHALEGDGRLLSVYRAADGTKFWVITEADRSATTVLLPEDY